MKYIVCYAPEGDWKNVEAFLLVCDDTTHPFDLPKKEQKKMFMQHCHYEELVKGVVEKGEWFCLPLEGNLVDIRKRRRK